MYATTNQCRMVENLRKEEITREFEAHLGEFRCLVWQTLGYTCRAKRFAGYYPIVSAIAETPADSEEAFWCGPELQNEFSARWTSSVGKVIAWETKRPMAMSRIGQMAPK